MKRLMLLIWSFLPLLFSCEKEAESIELSAQSSCDQVAIVDQDLYDNAPSSQLTIEEIEIVDDCLRVRFSASGCSGESWKLRLIGSEQVNYSQPPQRDIRFVLENDELCQAYFTKEMTFDITALRSNGEAMLLNVIDSEQGLLYNH